MEIPRCMMMDAVVGTQNHPNFISLGLYLALVKFRIEVFFPQKKFYKETTLQLLLSQRTIKYI